MRTVLYALVGATLALGACSQSKPSEEECREAIENIRVLTGRSELGADPTAMIRSCRARSTRESVKCAADAQSIADLERCEGDIGQDYYREEEERLRKLKDKEEEQKRTKEKDA